MAQSVVVMAGLVPAIHAAPLQGALKVGALGAAWMPGTRPGMTVEVAASPSATTDFVSPDGPAGKRVKETKIFETAI